MTRWLSLFCVVAVLALPALASDPQTLSVGGRDRSYRIYRPPTLSRQAKAPLVVMLHGALGSGAQAERAYGWDREADGHGFVVAYPDGIGRTWNAGGACCGRANRTGVDDVAFLDTLIAAVSHAENIDPARIYITGMSNGGAMTYRYACEGHTRLAAIAPVAASFTYACPAVPALPVMAIHGLQDRTVPFQGGEGRRGRNLVWMPVEASLDQFRHAGHCAAASVSRAGVVAVSTARCDRNHDVVLITVADGGHQWPGSEREAGLGAALLDLDTPSAAFAATPRLWNFFARYTSD
jgi:polyhydroxybutyrate depolymerase